MYLFTELINAVVIGYLLVVVGVVAFAWIKPKKRSTKVIATTIVLAVMVGPLAYAGLDNYLRVSKARKQLEIAEAMFQERCKESGVRIHRTDKDVEGVLLLKIRPDEMNHSNQYALTDPYGKDTGGDGYIIGFLRGSEPSRSNYPHRFGYSYVEAVDPQDGIRYRYTGSMKIVGRMDETAPNVRIDLERNPKFDLNIYRFGLTKLPAPGEPPRYGITYDDLSTRKERDYWIAGSSLRIIDLQNNEEVVAERIGYMMDRGQGANSGGRSPWLWAADHACPEFHRRFNIDVTTVPGFVSQAHQTYDFVESVLRPRLEK